MPQKKKILFLITKGNFGGAQRYVFDLATGISKNKFDVVVAHGEGAELFKKLSNEGIKTLKVKNLKRDLGIFSEWRAFREIQKIIYSERPDIIHLNSSKAGFLGVLAGRLSGVKKIIFTGHGWVFNEDRNFISRTVFYFIHWLTIILCHKTIAVSDKVKQQIHRLPLLSKKTIRIYNGIDFFETLSKEEARKIIAPERKESFWIGTISELHKNKGLDYAIKSLSVLLKKNSDIIAIIIGEGEEKIKIKKLIKDEGLEEKIILTGFIPDARVLLKSFDIFFLSSRTEAFPYAILESGIAKIPTIATNVGGIPEIIENKKTGLLIKPSSPNELEKAFETIILDRKIGEEMANNLNKITIDKFKKSTMIFETEKIYSNHDY